MYMCSLRNAVHCKIVENKIPTVTGQVRVNATVNQTVNLSAYAYDKDNQNVTVYFTGSIMGNLTNQQNATITEQWTPEDYNTNYDIR